MLVPNSLLFRIQSIIHISARFFQSRFPGMEQDLTFVVNRCQPILDAVKAENSPLVQKVTVLGTYSDITGKTITIRLSFSHPERTLTRDEVQAVVDGVVARLKGQGIELKK